VPNPIHPPLPPNAWETMLERPSHVAASPPLAGDRRPALSERASSHAMRGRLAVPSVLLAVLLAACGEGRASESELHFAEPQVAREVSPEAQAVVDELLAVLERPDPTLTSDHHDRWFHAQKACMAELLERGDVDLGIAALRTWEKYAGEDTLRRQSLLTVAAHNAPEESRGILEHLMLTFGYRMVDRAEATRLLAETSPERFLEAARPFVLRRGRPRQTMPNDEFFVQGWVSACEKVGRSPVPEMAEVVTNLMMEPYARTIAAKTLGRYPDPLGRKALETALIESSGDGYLRRKAAQAIRDSVPAEEACTLFSHVLSREADINFAIFLRDLIESNCP